MWVWTTGGFVSAVEHRQDKDAVMIRARDRQSLETMLEGLELCGNAWKEDGKELEVEFKIESSGKGDYRHRVVMPKTTFALWLQFEVLSYLTYPNFKSELAKNRGPEFVSAAHSVWSTMHKVSDGEQVYGTVGKGGSRIWKGPKGGGVGAYGGYGYGSTYSGSVGPVGSEATGGEWVGSTFFDSELTEYDEVDADSQWDGDLPEGSDEWSDDKFEAYLDFMSEEHGEDVVFDEYYEDLVKAEAAYKLSGGLSKKIPVTEEIAESATSSEVA